MQRMEHIDAAARRLQRIKATLGMVAVAGLDSGLSSVMEVNGLVRQEVDAALAELEAALLLPVDAAMAAAPGAQPQGMGCGVITLRPSQRA